MVERMEPSSSLQSTWNFFYKLSKKLQQGSSPINKLPIQGHMLIEIENLPHMQLVFSLSFVKLLWPFERIISYTHDQDHVQVNSHAILLHLEGSKYIHPSIHPQIKLYVVPCLSLSKGMGYTKRNKRCIPKEGMPHAHKACQKKGENMHTQRRYATHPQGVSKKRERKKKM